MATDGPAGHLTDLRNGLLRLHKTLLDSERAHYEHEVEKIRSTGQMLELVLHDPWFAWLRELSGLVVLIDEAIASDQPVTAGDAERFIGEARSLLMPKEQGQGFARRYFEALQRDPGNVLAHREATRLMQSLAGAR
jgi:hypothetical protein